jgi:uncharacterized protein YcnI
MSRIPHLVPATLAGALIALCLAASPAAAHVTIPEPVDGGGFGIVTFSVPNERDDASTVTLEVQMPQDQPLASVRPQPKPGWTVETTTRTLDEPVELFGREVTEVVDTVRWTGGSIDPGQFDTFTIQAGPFPEEGGELAFPSIQTYSSGEEVAWIETAEPGGEEPESPAPVLTVTAADGDGDAGDGSSATDGGAQEVAAATADDDDDDSGWVNAVAIAALAVAVVALALTLNQRRAR